MSELKFEYDTSSVKELMEEMKMIRNRLDALEKTTRIDTEVKDSKSKILMPWIGVVNESCCRGLRMNHGLFTQCENKFTTGNFCKTCFNQGAKNGSGIPNHGTVDERLKYDIMGYVDKNTGKKCIPWFQVLQKLNVDIDQAKQQASELNIQIPQCHMTISEKKRGRPKKNINTSVSDTDSEGGVGMNPPKRKEDVQRRKRKQQKL